MRPGVSRIPAPISTAGLRADSDELAGRWPCPVRKLPGHPGQYGVDLPERKSALATRRTADMTTFCSFPCLGRMLVSRRIFGIRSQLV
jgi:hypothetical protein